MAFVGGGVESELNLVDTVGEAEKGEVGSLHHGDNLVQLALLLGSLIEGSNRHEMSELLSLKEVFKDDTFVHLVVKGDVVESLLKLETDHLVVSESFLWQEIQVLLKSLSDQVALDSLEEGFLSGLGAEHGKHSPGDANDGEVGILLHVVVTRPLHDSLYRLQVLLILVALFAITWDVETVDALKFLDESLWVGVEVDRNDAGASRLKEISMGALKETLKALVEVSVPGIGKGLRQHSENGLVRLGSHVVTGVQHDGFAFMAAEVMGSVALISEFRVHSWLTEMSSVGVELALVNCRFLDLVNDHVLHFHVVLLCRLSEVPEHRDHRQ